VYWLFNSSILGTSVSLRPSEGANGCQCHFDIEGLANAEAKRIYKEQEKEDRLEIHICLDDGIDRQVCFEADHEILLDKALK
jgi:hypothetical protein